MAKLPSVTGKDAIKAFAKAGFVLARTSASHHILKREGHPHRLSIPVHAGKTLGKGLLLSLIALAGLTKEEFFELLNS